VRELEVGELADTVSPAVSRRDPQRFILAIKVDQGQIAHPTFDKIPFIAPLYSQVVSSSHLPDCAET
jgi:hypothetical protein